ncbi:MAG: hypothetical protein ACLPKW_18695, partial [Acetobacteraceae bacterium]
MTQIKADPACAGHPVSHERCCPDRQVRPPRATLHVVSTAPHFSPAVTAADYAGWLGMLEDDAALSLYLHMPFCARLCWFCACHTSVVHRLEPLENYGKTL